MLSKLTGISPRTLAYKLAAAPVSGWIGPVEIFDLVAARQSNPQRLELEGIFMQQYGRILLVDKARVEELAQM